MFLSLLAMAAVTLIAFALDEPPNSAGIDHPELDTMRRGGPPDRHSQVLWLGWALGLAQVSLFVTLIAFGARRRADRGGLGRRLAAGAALYALTWTALVAAYRVTAANLEPALWLGFPAPTAVMLFGIWPVPLVFVWLYVGGFRRWVWSDEDQRAFEALLERARRG